MFRYVALCCDPKDRSALPLLGRYRAQLNAPEWQVESEGPGYSVHSASRRPGSDHAYLLGSTGGVILGKLFSKEGVLDCGVSGLDQRVAARIVQSGGTELVEHFWGRYVAFIRDPHGNRLCILRDPTGTLPCFMTRVGPVTIYFSRLEDVLALGMPRFSINWDYIAVHLPSIVLESRQTGLDAVFQVRAGERVVAGDDQSGTFLWDAALVAKAEEPIEDITLAAKLLRSTVHGTVQAWASCYEGVLIRLSGGLDSSIVLGCLSDPRLSNVTCINYYSTGSDSDERRYARIAAAAAGRRLLERQREDEMDLARMLDIAPHPLPSFYFARLEQSTREAATAREVGATAICTGAGGDQLFHQNATLYPAIDCFARHGWSSRFLRVSLETARLARASIWQAIGAALRAKHRKESYLASEVGRDFTLIASDVVEAARVDERFSLHSLESCSEVPPGKLRQLRSFAFPIEYYDPLGVEGDPDGLHPLFSQPVMELCLRIPTYVLANGGWDRALARQAFSGDLPREIVSRRSKGGQEEHAKAVLGKNVQFLREMLLEGELARHRLLNKARLEEALSNRPTAIATSMAELLSLISVECWTRSCTQRQGAASRGSSPRSMMLA